MLGDVTLRVGLDKEVEVTSFFVGGDRGVGAQNFLGLAFNDSCEGDVLTDGQTQDISGTGQSETIDADVVGDFGFLLENEILEFVGTEDFSGLLDSVSRQAVEVAIQLHMNKVKKSSKKRTAATHELPTG